jgi:hypothetical protein
MKHLLERLVLLALSQELDALALQPPTTIHPRDYLAKALERIKPRLSGMGITEERLATTVHESDLKRIFVPHLVPNPAYWRQHLLRQMRFYMIHSRASRYHELVGHLKGMSSISYATCYGAVDVIVKLVATEEHFQYFESTLDDLGADWTAHPVAVVPYYLGHPERKVPRSQLASDQIDSLLAARADSIASEQLQLLLSSGIALGVAVREDNLATGRIRALVHISLRGGLNASTRDNIEKALIGFNLSAPEGHAMPVVSLYRIQGSQYFLEMICDDQAQLDRVTDKLQSLDRAIEDAETLIIARYEGMVELYTLPHLGVDERSQQMKNVVDNALMPISDRLRAQLSERHEAQFAGLDPHVQLRILSLYQELTEDGPYLGHNRKSMLQPAVVELVTGVIEGNKSRINNAGLTVVRDHVETPHKVLLIKITDEIFAGDDQKWQSEFKMSDALWQKWGLRAWGERVYPKWNEHSLLHHLFKVEPDILESLRFLGDARNSFAHPRDSELGQLTHIVREVFNHSYKVRNWLESVSTTLANPTVPFQAVVEAIGTGRPERHLELIKNIKVLQVDLERLTRAAAQQRDEQLREIAQGVRDLAGGMRELDATLVERVSTSIVPMLATTQQSSAAAMLDALKGSIGTVPAGVASSLLAALMTAALRIGQ